MSLTSNPRRHPNGSSSPLDGQDETIEKITGAMKPTPTPAPNANPAFLRSTKAPRAHNGQRKSVKSTNGVKTSSVTSSPSKS